MKSNDDAGGQRKKKRVIPLTCGEIDISEALDDSLAQPTGEVLLAQQKLVHRRVLFWTCIGICAGLYLLFALLVIRAWCSDAFFQTLLNYKHIGAFILALLVVPSALLWGLLRAAYMPEHSPKEADSLVKAATSLHPAGDA